MVDLQQFCDAFDIDAEDSYERLRLAKADAASALSMPWYARLFVGVGAWITALIAIALGGSILAFLDVVEEISLVVMGAIYFIPGIFWLRTAGLQVYATHLGIAITAAGMALMVAGVGLVTEEIWASTLCSAMLTGAIIFAGRHRALQFLAALLTAMLFVAALYAEDTPYYLDIAALTGPAAVYLMLQPPRRDVQPTAIVLLITMPMFGVFHGIGARVFGELVAGGWVAKIVYVAVFLWLAYLHWQRVADEAARYRLGIFAVAAVVVGLLLPPGGSASLAIIMLAFTLGSLPLAVLGILLQIYYLWFFYYDMDVTLLTKSWVLMAVGAVLIFAWWLMERRTSDEEAA